MPYDITKDPFGLKDESPDRPAKKAVAITPDDNNDLTTYAKALYIGVAGDVTVLPTENDDGDYVTFKNRPVGDFPIAIRRLRATNTTASEIIAYIE